MRKHLIASRLAFAAATGAASTQEACSSYTFKRGDTPAPIGIARLPVGNVPPATTYNRFSRWTYPLHENGIMEAVANTHIVDTVMLGGTSKRVHHSTTTL